MAKKGTKKKGSSKQAKTATRTRGGWSSARSAYKKARYIVRRASNSEMARFLRQAADEGTLPAMFANPRSASIIATAKAGTVIIDKLVNSGEYFFSHWKRETEMPEAFRQGEEMGKLYKQVITYNEDIKHSELMATQLKETGTQRIPCFDSSSSEFTQSADDTTNAGYPEVYSTAGMNRQGIYAPLGVEHGTSTYSAPSPAKTNVEWWTYWRTLYTTFCMTEFQLSQEIWRKFTSTETQNKVLDTSGKYDSSDWYYNICQIRDEITFFNGMQLAPLNLKIYVCRCKRPTYHTPQMRMLMDEEIFSDYQYPKRVVNNFEGLFGTDNGFDFYTETSVNLGVTPAFSPGFNLDYEIIDVVKWQILPQDQFRLTINRNYHQPRSLQNAVELIDNNHSQNMAFSTGDICLMPTFTSSPGQMVNTNEGNEYGYGYRAKSVPIRMSTISNSSIVAGFKDYTNPLLNDSFAADQSQYVASRARELNTDIQTLAFSDNTLTFEAMSNTSLKTGGAKAPSAG